MGNEKKETTVPSQSTAMHVSLDPNLRAILDSMQKQNERHETAMLNLQKSIQDESVQRMKEIEMIGKKLGMLETGLSSICTSEFGSIITEDGGSGATARQATRRSLRQAQQTTRAATVAQVNPPRPNPPAETHSDYSDEEVRGEYDNPQYSAKVCLDFIPTLNGQDDIGVEGFIKAVREARAECRDKRILLKLILTQRIIGEAERSIRHIEIENFTDLFEALRKFVSINITSNGARDKLQRTRQGNTESVHSYIKRFRQQLNELIYALQHEVRDPVRRAVAIDLENERATKTFLLNLRQDIEIRTSNTKPRNLQEAQEAAFEAELFIGEIERSRNTFRRMEKPQSFPKRNIPPQTKTPIKSQYPNNPVMNKNPIPQPKCFKCQQTGHLAHQCPKQNFIYPSQRTNPPIRNHHLPTNQETEYECTPQQEDSSQLEQWTNTEDQQLFSSIPEQE